jgi:hypothetical protein
MRGKPQARSSILRWSIRMLPGVFLALAIGRGGALAAEARPWLCRDKPVFSSSSRSHMDLASHDSRRWKIFLMQFDPSGGHDGFTITNTYDLGPANRHASEDLDPGRFFTVALYQAGGHWICHGSALDRRTPGTIADICYGAGSEGACDVVMKVTSKK